MKNIANPDVPNLRFPGFEGAWQNRALVESFPKIRNGFVGTATPFYQPGGITYFQGKNIKNGVLDFSDTVEVSEAFHAHQKKSKVNALDILMVQSGHVGECAFVPDNVGEANCHALVVMTPNKDTYSPFFVYYFYTDIGKRHIYKIKTGNTIEHILTSDLKPLLVATPKVSEQKKIANFLMSIDLKISQIERKRGLLETYKQGCIEKIFSQGIRFKADDGSEFPNWVEKKLEEVVKYEQPTKYLVASSEYSQSYKIPVLTAGKTFILGYTNEEDGIYTKLPVVIFDDFTTAFKYVDFPFKAKSSAMKMLTLKNKKDDLRFVYAAMGQMNFQVGEHKRYWIAEYQNQYIPYPSPDEQRKIASFLASIDSKIEGVKIVLERTKAFKKGLLQQMYI